MNELLLHSGLAFVEGIGLALSPCILPVLPLVLAGGAAGNKRGPLGIITGFVLGFTVFSLLSRKLFELSGIGEESVRTGSFVLLAAFGLVMLVPALEERFSRATQGLAARAQRVKTGEGFSGGVAMGLLIGLIWAPCAGPLLAAALVQVIRSKTDLGAVVTVVAFGLGSGLPMLAVAFFGKALVLKFSRHAVALRRGMGVLLLVFAGLGLAGVNVAELASPQARIAAIPDSEGLLHALDAPYPAPAFAGLEGWLNSPPLTVAGLRGKVVLIDFWTYSCINCLRTLPHLKDWQERYAAQGLVIVGVHAPEFAFERAAENVARAAERHELAYPIARDNGFKTWDAYKNRYWPAHYLIDREGRVVYTHFGEGQYEVTEHNIRRLLGLAGGETSSNAVVPVENGQTPETYLGSDRAENEWTGPAGTLPLHGWKLDGDWTRAREEISAGKTGATLMLKFRAKKVFLVMAPGAEGPGEAEIVGAGEAADVKAGRLHIDTARAYEIVRLPETAEAAVTVRVLTPGVKLFALTFEGN